MGTPSAPPSFISPHGVGMNLGLLACVTFYYGWGKTMMWIGILLLVVMEIPFGIERPFYPVSIEAADHTYAFDIACQAFQTASPPTKWHPAEI